MEHRWAPAITTIASLADAPQGRDPTSLVRDSNGNLFGTTLWGGSFGDGTVFEVQVGSGTLTTIATFNGANGANPENLTLDSSGDLFGTTAGGGLSGQGTLFKIQHGSDTVSTLAAFDASVGSPTSLIMDSAGDFFGTAQNGGAYGYGAVFEITKGSSTVVALATFNRTNGGYPNAGLVEDSNGNLFGTMQIVGNNFNGGVFEVGYGSGSVTTVATFDHTNGTDPLSTVVEDTFGNLFGSTPVGGVSGHGTIFEIASGTNAITTLVDFDGSNGLSPGELSIEGSGNLIDTVAHVSGYDSVIQLSQGSNSMTTLATFNSVVPGTVYALIEDSSGNLFGVGDGPEATVFEITNGSGTATPLAFFPEITGYLPVGSPAQDSNGNFFGMTSQGGPFNEGTVFEVPKGSGAINVLGAFNGTNGEDPSAVVVDGKGDVFGTTKDGGSYGYGTVFEVQAGSGIITTIVNFHGSDGATPDTLLQDDSGNLFGTTASGGTLGYGTVFEIQNGSDAVTTLASFSSNGSSGFDPGALTEDSSGNLLGVNALGGPAGYGGVFELARGTGPIITLASFNGHNGAGGGNLIADQNGNIFGITGSMTSGNGAVFEIPAGTNNVMALASFTDQSFPGGLVEDSNGNLFGDTEYGGAYGAGSVFEWQKAYRTLITVGSFNGANGRLPSGLIADSAGNLVGMTSGGGTVGDGTVFGLFLNPPFPIFLPSAWAGTSYTQSLASGGTAPLTYAATGSLPTGMMLSSTGVLSGTPTSAGTFTFNITLTDPVGVTASQTCTLTVNPGPFAQFLVTLGGSSTVQAGSGFLVAVQAADQFGNPVTSYSGPTSVPVNISPKVSGFPNIVTINGQGLGLFLGTIQQAGSYTIGVSGASTSVTITAGPPVKLAFAAAPGNTPTGVPLAALSVQVLDLYGNVVTGDNSDTVTLGIAVGPGSFTSGSTLTATVQNGVATFNHLTLVTPGLYQLSAVVPGLYTGPSSASFSVLPLQVIPGSFQGTPSGFSLQLNAPILINSLTPALYGSGSGVGASVTPTVTLTQVSGTPPAGAALPYPVPGSLIVDSTDNTLTFVETDTASVVDNGTPLLADGEYVVDISSSGASGLQALYRGGGYLDGSGAGTPGHDFTATFPVSAAGEDVLWVPATADGPGQALSAPGKNQLGGGYPVYLDDQSGSVTDVQATLSYNPTLLNVMPSSSATFTVTVPSPGTALLHYHGPALATGMETPIGFLTASVPAGTASNPVPYKARDLLTLSGISLNNGALAAVGAEAVHLVAYVGDADGNGSYSSNDAVLTTRVALQTDTGFTAYPVVDPVIVADTDGSGFIPADAALQVNEAGVGAPTANLAIPPIPSGVHFETTLFHAEARPSLPAGLHPQTGRVATRPAQRFGRGPLVAPLGFFITDRRILDVYFARLEDA